MKEEAPCFDPDPTAVERSRLTAFTRFCEAETGRRFPDYSALHAFALSELQRFWSLFLRWSELIVEGSPERVLVGGDCEGAVFFPDLRLSYTENLLAGGDEATALVACDESGRETRITRSALRDRVVAQARALRRLGVKPGDRVVGVARNTAESAIACLAATGLGASWSAVPPDLGTDATLARFVPLEPALLFAHTRYPYQGVERSIEDRIAALRAGLPSLRAFVSLDDAIPEQKGDDEPWTWPRFPFNHPLFILFSSGTTGPPKCIVHGIGGTLLEHVKEHRLHSDLGPTDTLFFQTSCGWMMWNWQLSALASQTRVVLYDGSVSHPEEDVLWRVVSREGVSVFGTSPAYLQYCREAGIVPADRADLTALRAIQSTGSILFDSLYDWIGESVKRVPVQSISGGTDIIGCFVLGNPNLPVYRGEAQCVSLGLDVRALRGEADPPGHGELICANPFPSRPVGLFGDPEGRRFHAAYFSQNPGVWTHGDFIEITPRGTARLHGRSDGVMNIRGVRIGPAEIYRILEGVPEIREAMAVEQAWEGAPGGSRLVLLVVMASGATLDRPLTLRIKKLLSERGSMTHVPAAIVELPGLPTTHSGKRSERAAHDALNGRPVRNLGALKNPECLEALRAHAALRA